jgi:CO/xanthine dehydrogenase FAD-binding subunit
VSFTLATPATATEVLRLLAERPEETAVLAGGTDLLFDLEEGSNPPRQVISLRRLPWRAVRWEGPRLAIGALAPLSEIEGDAGVRRRLPALAKAVHAVGSIALRHRATLGGNLGRSSPTSDLIPLLLVLDAKLRLISAQGRRELAVDDFVRGSRRTALAPGELIESVTIPAPLASDYLWQRVRLANDISQVGVAVARSGSPPEWRIALGGVSPRAIRLPTAEKLMGQGLPAPLALELAAQEAAKRAPFLTDKRATESYRRRLVYVLVKRAVGSVTGGVPPSAPKRRSSAAKVARARRPPPETRAR